MSKMVQKDAEQESEMRAEIQEMKKEQATISMMDEFARHARLERRINKMTDRLKTHGGVTHLVYLYITYISINHLYIYRSLVYL